MDEWKNTIINLLIYGIMLEIVTTISQTEDTNIFTFPMAGLW